MTPTEKRPTPHGGLPTRTDVLVVGAGPTGLSLACGLAQRGIDHVVIDHAPRVAAYSQSTMVDARTLEALDDIDAGELLVRRGVKGTQFSLRDGDKKLVVLDFSSLPTKYPFALMVPESTAAGVLAERLASYGSPVFRPVTAIGLAQNAESVTVDLWDGTQSGSPARRSIVARYVVGCDGMHSQIRSALAIPFVGPSRTEPFIMADVRMQWPFPRSEVELFFSSEGLLVVAPLPDNRFRILATVDGADRDPDLAEMQALLTSRGPRTSPARVQEVPWSTRLRVDGRLATHYRSGRVFLAGDAAHVHSPAGGQGMNSGIQDALYLAGKLADVITGLAKDDALNQYEAERRSVAQSVQQLTRRMSFAATLQGQRGPRIRNRVLGVVGRVPAFRHAFTRRIAGIAWSRRRRASDDSHLLYVFTLGLVALLVGSSFVHSLEFHTSFAYLVGLVQGAALVASSWLAAKRKRERRGFAISAMAAACLFAAFATWLILIRSYNADVATLYGHADVAALRASGASNGHGANAQWEISHWARVVLQLCSFALLASARR